jgi:benzoyl-CoA reductase/2-hydroxyglutaryl-CoA dehydratase subunit BcrC/BadD/HgdB
MTGMEKLSQHVRGRTEEFAKMKKEGRKIVGYAPGGFMPEDMVWAVGAVPVPLLRGGSHEAVAASGAYLPRFVDTFCRSQIGFFRLGDELLYQLPDLVVVPITDNNMRAVAEMVDYFTDRKAFRYGIPHCKDELAYDYYSNGLHQLKDKLEAETGNKLDEGKLKEELALSNKMWELLDEISQLRKSSNPPITGQQFVKLNHATYYADKKVLVECLEEIYGELKGKEGPKPAARILLTGSTLANGDYKILDMVENAGCDVVFEEFAEGMRHYWERVDLSNSDIMKALADRYFAKRQPPAWFRPSTERIYWLEGKAKEYKVDGIVWYQLMYRDGYDIQHYYFEKIMDRDLGLKTLKVESDYDSAEIGPLKTRVEAFAEMLRVSEAAKAA